MASLPKRRKSAKLAPIESGRALAVLKRENHMGVARFGLISVGQDELPGHPEMDEEKLLRQVAVGPVQRDEDVLSVAGNVQDLPGSERPNKIFRYRKKDIASPQGDARNPPP